MKVVLARARLTNWVSGADEALVNYALHLRRAGHLHSVTLLYHPAPDNPYYVRLREAGVRVDRLSSPPAGVNLLLWGRRSAIQCGLMAETAPPRSASALLRHAGSRFLSWRLSRSSGRLRRHFAASGADLVHVVGSEMETRALVRAARRADVPVLLHELGCVDRAPEHRFHLAALRRIEPLCTELAALSPSLAASWRSFHGRRRPVRVLPAIQEDVRTERRVPSSGAVTFGYAARLEHSKGLPSLLTAFARLHAARPGAARLVVAGLGSLEQVARERVAELGLDAWCDIVGYVPEANKAAMLASLDAFVLPSLAEGTPMAVIEAMSFGLPVIASDVGGLSDMLSDGGGLLVAPRDVDALVAAMTRLVDEPGLRRTLGGRARERYERLFHPDAVLHALLHEYRRIIGPAPGRDARAAVGRHPWLAGELDTPTASALPCSRLATVAGAE